MKRQIGKFYVSHRFFTGVPLDGVNLSSKRIKSRTLCNVKKKLKLIVCRALGYCSFD